MLLSLKRRYNTNRVSGSLLPSLTSHQFLAITGMFLFLSLRHAHNFQILQFSFFFPGAFYLWSLKSNNASNSICRNFLMKIPQPMGVSPECTWHSLDGSFYCFQGRRFILLDLRLCNKCFSFPKVCSCLNRERLTGQRLLALPALPKDGLEQSVRSAQTMNKAKHKAQTLSNEDRCWMDCKRILLIQAILLDTKLYCLPTSSTSCTTTCCSERWLRWVSPVREGGTRKPGRAEKHGKSTGKSDQGAR